MSNIFNNYTTKSFPLLLNTKFSKVNPIQNNSKKDNCEAILYPYSTKEWATSSYTYNKSYEKSLVVYAYIANILTLSYSNMLSNKIKVVFKRRRANKSRYSVNRVYGSKTELKYSNTTITFVLHLYNKYKSFSQNELRNMFTFNFEKMNFVQKKQEILSKYKNRLFSITKPNFSAFNLWGKHIIQFITGVEKYFKPLNDKYTFKFNIPDSITDWLDKIRKTQINVYSKISSLNFNNNKYNNSFMRLGGFGLISLLNKIYKKISLIEIIDFKSIYLSSSTFIHAVVLKLKNRLTNVVPILKKAIQQQVRIPLLHTLITFDNLKEKCNKNNIVTNIRQQVVSGVRFEAAGRLTKRLTAMRSVFKVRYVGSIQEIRSSFNKIASILLRGFVQSNSDYTDTTSNTRNGTYGVKCWVCCHEFKISFHLTQIDFPQITFIPIDFSILFNIPIDLSLTCIPGIICGLLGIVLLSSIWNWKVLTPVPPKAWTNKKNDEKDDKKKEDKKKKDDNNNKCPHSIIDRMQLRGDVHFQIFKDWVCVGGNRLMTNIEYDTGQICTACQAKFCSHRGCSCKRI